ncbi:Mov34/MPN/PAD-1 family protein [Kocuria palustris]|nr:Mov34/MPN/PAD-1 family protein [Kocuria palustris]
MLCRDLCDVFAHNNAVNTEVYALDEHDRPRAQASGTDKPDFWRMPQMSPRVGNRPWRLDPDYFQKVYISGLAVAKMAIHAKSGGNLEVMGMLTGKIIPHGIVVMDVYQLPVEGTETRVNAQAEGYEYMVQFSELLKEVGGRSEHIVGWYHTHPGYGCWLSGIDVNTQALQQGFQDPYLAIVVDPHQSSKQNKVEIGAFRTYPEGHKPKKEEQLKLSQKDLPANKRKDFGTHADRYYSLAIEIFHSPADDIVIPTLLASEDNNLTHLTTLLADTTEGTALEVKDDHLNRIGELTRSIAAADILVRDVRNKQYMRKFLQQFQLLANKRIVREDRGCPWIHQGVDDSDDDGRDVIMGDDIADDESDLERKSNHMSDGDDAVLMDLNLAFDDMEDEPSPREVLLRREVLKRLLRKRPLENQLAMARAMARAVKDQNVQINENKLLGPAIKLANRAIAKREAQELMTLLVQQSLFG